MQKESISLSYVSVLPFSIDFATSILASSHLHIGASVLEV